MRHQHRWSMIYSYAGISTDGQSARAKVRQVIKAGCRTRFRELDIDEGGVAGNLRNPRDSDSAGPCRCGHWHLHKPHGRSVPRLPRRIHGERTVTLSPQLPSARSSYIQYPFSWRSVSPTVHEPSPGRRRHILESHEVGRRRVHTHPLYFTQFVRWWRWHEAQCDNSALIPHGKAGPSTKVESYPPSRSTRQCPVQRPVKQRVYAPNPDLTEAPVSFFVLNSVTVISPERSS